MTRIDEANTQRSIESVSVRLITGYQYHTSSYGSVRAMAGGLFATSSADLNLLIAEVQPEHRLVFTVGSTAVLASSFTREPLDYLREESEELVPGQSLVLERAAYYRDSSVAQIELEANQLYVGDFGLLVAAIPLAKSLNEQGTLTLVTADAALALA